MSKETVTESGLNVVIKQDPPKKPEPIEPLHELMRLAGFECEQKTLGCMWHPGWSVGTTWHKEGLIRSIRCPLCHPEDMRNVYDVLFEAWRELKK